jgi:hypothetical protein
MMIFCAVVAHRHGTDVFVSKTEAGLYRDLAAWCRNWWDETAYDTDAPRDNEECVQRYFDAMDNECCTITTATLSE